MNDPGASRRELLKALALAAAALAGGAARAADDDRLDPADPAAVALGYVKDASKVDIKKYPTFVPGSACENCLQLQGSAGNTYRPCAAFKGKLVAVGGWCSAWTAEM